MEEVIINALNISEDKKQMKKKIYQIKEQMEIEQLKGKVKTNKNIAIQEKIDDITNDDKIQAEYDEKIKNTDETLLEKVTEEQVKHFDKDYEKEETKIKEKYQKELEKLEKHNMLSEPNKIIVIKSENKIEGFIEYQTINHDNTLDINVISLYINGQKKMVQEKLINSLSEGIVANSLKTNIDMDNVITNIPSLQTVPEYTPSISLDILEPQDLKLHTIEDIEQNPELLNNLTTEQMQALKKLVEEDAVFIDLEKGIGVTEQDTVLNAKQNGDDYVVEMPSILNDENFKIDESLNNYQPSIEVKKEEEKQEPPQLVKKNYNKKKQGYVDALVFTLITGFVAGIFTTLSFLIIYMKLG